MLEVFVIPNTLVFDQFSLSQYLGFKRSKHKCNFHFVAIPTMKMSQILKSAVLQVRVGQWSIITYLQPLIAHIYHVMIIVTGSFSKK